MADKTVDRGTSPVKLSRTDRIDLALYAAGAALIAFLPQILACCGVL